jgi:hypothetical protein
MHLRNPNEEEFAEIFGRFCRSRELACPEGLLKRFVDRHYRSTGKRMRRCHPRDVLSHALDLIHFHKLPRVLNDEVLDYAFRSCFIEVSDMEA